MKGCAAILALAVFAFTLAVSAEETGPNEVVVVEATNPEPESLPTIRIVREKLWGEYFPMVSTTFPNVPGLQCDSWCYESGVDLVDAKALDGGRVEMRHRARDHAEILVVTTIAPEPSAVLFEARVELDLENHPGAAWPESAPGLNLCWQLRHAPAFASVPDSYPDFVKRCFIFTEKGRTFLLDTERRKIPVAAADHEHNNPPWVQSYVGVWQELPVAGENAWADFSPDKYVARVIGAVSRDGKYLAAIANDSAMGMSQAWHDCMHNNPAWTPKDAPIQDQRWRLRIYAMENDPNALLARVAKDFPDAEMRN